MLPLASTAWERSTEGLAHLLIQLYCPLTHGTLQSHTVSTLSTHTYNTTLYTSIPCAHPFITWVPAGRHPTYPTYNPQPSSSPQRLPGCLPMQGLVATERLGRIRGFQWTMAVISQVYYDKIIHDATSDREGNPRMRICDFIYDWHLTRFGG